MTQIMKTTVRARDGILNSPHSWNKYRILHLAMNISLGVSPNSTTFVTQLGVLLLWFRRRPYRPLLFVASRLKNVIKLNTDVQSFFFIRTMFIRTPSLRFGQMLRIFWMLKSPSLLIVLNMKYSGSKSHF